MSWPHTCALIWDRRGSIPLAPRSLWPKPQKVSPLGLELWPLREEDTEPALITRLAGRSLQTMAIPRQTMQNNEKTQSDEDLHFERIARLITTCVLPVSTGQGHQHRLCLEAGWDPPANLTYNRPNPNQIMRHHCDAFEHFAVALLPDHSGDQKDNGMPLRSYSLCPRINRFLMLF